MFNSPAWAARIDAELAAGLVKAVSNPRLATYGLGASANDIEAVAKHGRNVVLSEAMYPILHMLEVVMRNSIHGAFRQHFQADDWYDQGWLNRGHEALVANAKAELVKRGRIISPDRVIPELRFGFWCGMFSGAYEVKHGPWPALLPSVLPRVPKSWRTCARVRRRVEEARLIRNRVFHHEPIAHLPDLIDRHRRFVELLGWFSPDARQHVEHLCRFGPIFHDSLVRTRMEPVDGDPAGEYLAIQVP